MKKRIRLFLFILIITAVLSNAAYAEGTSYFEVNGVRLLNLSKTKVEGFVDIQGETEAGKLKLLVEKNNEQVWYDVKLEDGKFHEQLWLNKGIGEYTIFVMVNEKGREYRFGPKLVIENIKEFNQLLFPDKHIESRDALIIEKAHDITKGLSSDMERARAIYEWVIENMKYDHEKYQKHLRNDYDNEYGALVALKTGKGVCYDYAALVAALGRAAGLETALVKGTGITQGVSGYHAWNEMHLSDQDRWIKLDTTFADVLGKDYFDNEDFDESHRIN